MPFIHANTRLLGTDKEYKQNTEKAILDLTAEINSLKKNYPGGEPKKILIDQKILYGLK